MKRKEFVECKKDHWIYYDSFSFQGEESFIGDRLVEGGHLTNGKGYREVREYVQPYILVRFYFVTRAYYSYTETILTDLYLGEKPDVLIMNSCLWDISRFELSFFFCTLTLSLPLTQICVNISTVYNDTLVAKGLIIITYFRNVYFFHTQLGLDLCPDMKSLHIFLNNALFRLQPKHFHVIIYTLFPKSSCQYTSPQPPPYFYRPTHNTDKIVSPSAIYSVS